NDELANMKRAKDGWRRSALIAYGIAVLFGISNFRWSMLVDKSQDQTEQTLKDWQSCVDTVKAAQTQMRAIVTGTQPSRVAARSRRSRRGRLVAVTPRGQSIVVHFRTGFAVLEHHSKLEPAEVDWITGAIVAHLRSWRPESVSPLGTLPEPD